MKFSILSFEELVSTNSFAKQKAEEGAPEGLVITAAFQTAGRGKLKNQWLSSRGKNLLFSVVTRPPVDSSQAPMLTQVSCRSVAAALKNFFGIDCVFKRPNDLLVHGKKICGILVESSTRVHQKLDYAIIGIGLNVNDYPEELKNQAVSMREILDQEINLNTLLNNILEQLGKDLEAFYHRPS